jgi:glyoxylase-like metal-dependent hydrolase (beta-lactamase superfamily II)
MKKLFFILTVLLLTNHSAWAKDVKPNFVVTKIAENVYSIISPNIGLPTPENKGWNSNIHFVVTQTGVLLFDSGSSESIGNNIKKAIKTVTDLPVRWLVNSHSHADHWLGNAAFSNTVIELIASEQTVSTMKKYGEDDVKFYAKVTKGTIGSTQLRYPNVILKQGQKRNFGGVDVEFIFGDSGHSPGDLLLWLPKQKIIFGGDVLSSDWMPMITDHGNIPNLIDSLHEFAELNPDIVLTGHGNATTGKSVIRDAEFLASVWEQVGLYHKKDLEPNEILMQVKAKLGPKYQPLYKNFESEIERYVELMYRLQQ